MTKQKSRNERQCELIEWFLEDEETEVICMRLYGRELHRLQKLYSGIVIRIDSPYKGSLYNCSIRKR